jgi:hypothetical protein
MSKREMSSKELLDQLYRGLDSVPAVEAEISAEELRRLAPMPPSDPSAPVEMPDDDDDDEDDTPVRSKLVRSPLVVLCGIAVAGTIAAAALRDSERRPVPAPPAPVVQQAPVAPPPVQVANVAPPEPDVVLTNPFDRTEKFTFPPGTSKADAREQMADLLLKRAIERKAHVPRGRKLAAEPHKSTPNTGRGS